MIIPGFWTIVLPSFAAPGDGIFPSLGVATE